MKTILQTDRTYLRVLKFSDISTVYKLESDSNVMLYQGGIRSKKQSYQAVLAKIEHQIQHDFSVWAVIHRDSNNFMGLAGLYHMSPSEIDISFRLHQQYWRQGFGTEIGKAILDYAFLTLQLDQVIGVARPDNLFSCKLLKTLDMKYAKEIIYDNKKFLYFIKEIEGHN